MTAISNIQEEIITGADIMIKSLVEHGVEVIFGYPGGAVLPIYDALFKQNSLRHILVRHEQAAVHAAEGYARSTGKVGAVLVTSGPGATNAVTGLTDAIMDSIPILCITGQVASHLIGNDAFQEADTTGITRPCTKYNYLVTDITDLERITGDAIHIATTGRPGPVVIDVPKDVLNTPYHYKGNYKFERKTYQPVLKAHDDKIKQAIDLIANAKRPIFYIGGGVINSGQRATDLLIDFVRETSYPLTATLMGLGAYPSSDPQFLGMLGMHGSLEANMAMARCDVMINIGARFDDRVTGRVDAFSPNSTKIHVDIDPSSVNKNVQVDLPIIGDAGEIIQQMLNCWREQKIKVDSTQTESWWQKINEWRGKDSFGYQQGSEVIKPQHAVKRLYELTKDRENYISTDVGQHQMWAAQLIGFDHPKRWLTSGGLGTMGYGLPAAMGAQVAHPDSLCVCVTGEASIMMNIQELSTLKQYRLPVKIFILNNRYMGMVRQWQELFHGGRYSESYMDSLPDFVMLAESYGLAGMKVSDPAKLDDAIKEMMAIDSAVIMDVRVDESENVYPMIPAGAAHDEIVLGPPSPGQEQVKLDVNQV